MTAVHLRENKLFYEKLTFYFIVVKAMVIKTSLTDSVHIIYDILTTGPPGHFLPLCDLQFVYNSAFENDSSD